MLEKSGLEFSDFELKDVNIDEQNYIRTISIGDSSKPTLVLVHGYGGSGVMFWKIIKPLIEHYYLIIID